MSLLVAARYNKDGAERTRRDSRIRRLPGAVAQARRNPLAERQKPRPKRTSIIPAPRGAPYCDVVWGNKIIALRFETYFANLVGQHIAPFPEQGRSDKAAPSALTGHFCSRVPVRFHLMS